MKLLIACFKHYMAQDRSDLAKLVVASQVQDLDGVHVLVEDAKPPPPRRSLCESPHYLKGRT